MNEEKQSPAGDLIDMLGSEVKRLRSRVAELEADQKAGDRDYNELRDHADALQKRVVELEAQRDSVYERFLDWRGVESPCSACSGAGYRAYGDTSTWRSGCGGQSVTGGICNKCWGTGDSIRKGVDLRRLKKGDGVQ